MKLRNDRILSLGLIIVLILFISCRTIISPENQSKNLDSLPEIPPAPPSPDDTANYKKYLGQFECIYNGKLKFDERLRIFPFNKAKKIIIVSYNAQTYKEGNDSLFTGEIPMKKGLVDFNAFKEIKSLNRLEIDSLSDILYNFNFRGPLMVEEHTTCQFIPENAIIFIDDNDKCFAYIELCFENEDYKLVPDTMNFGQFCNTKMRLIKKFIEKKGIKYGLNSNNC